jgi:glycosyltransferase involved in cell wall biosynthesis
MNILFIHQNFPGQFRHLAPALAAAGHRVDALAMHRGVAPTAWQASRLPAGWRDRVELIFDGIDTDRVVPDPAASFTHAWLPAPVRAGEPVVAFVNRNLEPYRGYHVFMRALPEFQRRRPADHRRALRPAAAVSAALAFPAEHAGRAGRMTGESAR